MTSWKTPTPEQVARAVALLVHAEQYRYFFDRLNNPAWLEPLWQLDFFKRPPAPVKDDVKGTVGFPPWPESRYLVRMATIPEVQGTVSDIALAVPETQNARVHEDLTDVALALPPPLASRFVAKAKQWLESAYQILLPEKLGSLVGHLARGGHVDAALELARALLAVLPDPRAVNTAAVSEEMRLRPEPAARFDVWHYEQILKKQLRELVDAAGAKAFGLVCDLLETAIDLSRLRSESNAPEDYSWIWRAAIEENEQNRRETVKTLLVIAVRDAAEQLATRAPDSVSELVRSLEARPWIVFRRIALHLLTRYPNAAKSLVEERFLKRDLFDDPRVRHEYVLLAAVALHIASGTARRTFLDWIEAGPDLEAFRVRYRELKGNELSNEDAERYGKIWRRDRLAPLFEALPPEMRARYEDLVREVGEPEHPEFAAYMQAGWVGPTSPKSADELRAMSVANVVELLTTWAPSADWFGPSKEGLGRELATIVRAEPERFAREAQLFVGIDPTYVRTLLGGLTDAAKEGRPFDWAAALELCDWAVRQPRDIQGRDRTDDEDPDWGWARKATGGLLSAGFAKGAAKIPFRLRSRVWVVLRPLTDDPEPTPEYEAQYGGPNMDPPTLSINTTRGEAMHAVVQYALWVRGYIEELPDEPARVATGFAEMPEVREVLESHLDPARDPSFAIRAVYGQWFPWLVLLDRAWVSTQLARIFPPERPDLRQVAWEAYIVFCPPYDNVLEVLKSEYSAAVERFGTERHDRHHLADPEDRLAQHLMLFYGRGKLGADPSVGLVGRFFERAPGRVRGKAIQFIGESLRDNKDVIPASVTERFVALWEDRIARARAAPEDFDDELANFGWWFVSRNFDESWSLEQLEEALRLAKKIEASDMNIFSEALADIAARRPLQAIRCLEGLIDGDVEGWGLLASQEHLRAIVAAATKSDDVEARKAATTLIDRLGARGHLGLRDLLG